MPDPSSSLFEALRPLFKPQTVAIIGASRTPGKHGNRPILNLLNAGYAGKIYLINPAAAEIEGMVCYPSVAAVPETIDCALMVIPSAGTLQSIRECAEAGVRSVVMGVTGFSELGTEEGWQREAELTTLARASGMRIVGPNTNGIFNASDRLPLGYNTSHSDPLMPGPISIAAHSGALFNGVARRLTHLGAGLSKYVAVGTEADLSLLDFFDYYIDDPDTRVIGLIIEAITDGPRFVKLAARARAAGKPVVALKLGRSVAGAGATIAHSRRLAGSARAYDALFEECRVAQVPSVEALAGGCATLLGRRAGAQKPASARSRALICTATTGGGSSLLADYADSYGMSLAGEEGGAWGGKVAEYIAGIDTAGEVRNPLDTSTLGAHERMTPFFEAQEADGFDGPMVTYTHMLPNPAMSHLIAEQIVARSARTGAPGVVIATGGLPPEVEAIYRASGVPLFYDVSTAFDSLSCHFQTLDEELDTTAEKAEAADLASIAPLLEKAAGPRVLSEWASAEILRRAGVPMVASRAVPSLPAAYEAAREFGYPLVLKALAPGVAHKNKLGFVRLGIADRRALQAAWKSLKAAIKAQGYKPSQVPLIIQPMQGSKAELIIGVSWEPPLGHFLVAGLGGIYTEALNESRLFPIPVAAGAMRKRLLATRLGRLLSAMDEGRGMDSPSVVDGVCASMDALQQLILAHGERIESIDVNPLLASEAACVAVDALVVLRDAG